MGETSLSGVVAEGLASVCGLDGRALIDDPRWNAALAAFVKRAHGLRIGILGGTFDPIHVGHLILAEQVAEELDLDGVLFMPAGNPSFKQDRKVTPAADRLAMVELAVADNPHFYVSDLEVKREGVTYTYDTLRELRACVPQDARLYFIMGSDTLASLHQWRNAEELAGLATFVGVDRPGQRHVTKDALERLAQEGFGVRIVQAPALEVSSSELRCRLADGKSVRYLIPASVMGYIADNGLYQ